MITHLRILDFAIADLRRNPAKTLVVVVVYSLLVAALASLLLYVRACHRESHQLLAGSPDIIVQRVRGGRHELTPIEHADLIREIPGVGAVKPRVWGYSFDPPTNATLTFWGADSVPRDSLEFAGEGLDHRQLEEGCIVGSGLADLRFLGIGDRFPIRRFDGTLFAPRVVGIFTTTSALLTNDLVILPAADLRGVFGMDDGLCTDISVEVHNPNEIANVAGKILERWPDARTITRTQILQTYDALFDWRGGLWASFLLSCMAAFAILIWDKGTGLTEEEFHTIGLLKAVGWQSREVMELKLFEGALVSAISLVSGLIIAQVHLLWFDGFIFARVIKGWSVLFPSFSVNPDLDLSTLLICVALTVVPYTAASLIPSWRASVTDPDTVLRN
jgi:ABC-type lipoprotein release transport system permease subunit